MALLNNFVSRGLSRAIFLVATRLDMHGLDRLPKRHDGLLLACVHLSHYDPFVISVALQRRVDWMARAEFYSTSLSAWMLDNAAGFKIERYGFALPGMREGLKRLEAGRLVGIFPEGEVSLGDASVLNGGPAKQGVALLARRAQVPIVPCVALNSRQFRNVVPWLPLRQGRLWVGFGSPIHPDLSIPHGRESRRVLTQRVEIGLRSLYGEMRELFDLPDEVKP